MMVAVIMVVVVVVFRGIKSWEVVGGDGWAVTYIVMEGKWQ